MDKITVVCHKDHDRGYEDYVGKCLLCEVERLEKREWVGLDEKEVAWLWFWMGNREKINGYEFAKAIEAKLKERNSG